MPASKLVVLWRITEICDLACPFCAYSRELRRSRTSADPDDILRFGALLSDYGRNYQRAVLVSWLGGEPLLWRPLFEISRVFKREFGLQVSLTTNGTRLGSAEVRSRIAADFDEITISVDGVGAGHDSGRRASGLYDRIQENVRRIDQLRGGRGHTPRLRVNTVLMRDNIHSFESLCQAAAEWGIEDLTFNALGGRDRPEFFPDHCLRPDDVKWLRESLPGIRERMAKLGLVILGSDRYLGRFQATVTNNQLPIADCQPGQHFLFIDERGVIAPCSFTTRGYGIHRTEIHSARDLAGLPLSFMDRQQAQCLAPCCDCPSTQVFGKFDPPPKPAYLFSSPT